MNGGHDTTATCQSGFGASWSVPGRSTRCVPSKSSGSRGGTGRRRPRCAAGRGARSAAASPTGCRGAAPTSSGDVLGDDDEGDRRGLVRRPGRVEHVEVGQQRSGQRPVRRLDDDQRDARDLALQGARARRRASSGSSEMNTARTSSAIERPTLTAWTTARLMPGIGTTTRSSRCGRLEDEVRADGQLAPRRAVLAVDEEHHRDEERDRGSRPGRRRRRTSRRRRRRGRRRSGRAPKPLMRQPPPPAGLADRRSQCRTMPIWLSVKQTKTPTE